MKLNLNEPFINLNGEPIEDSNLGKTLANLLTTSNKGDALKFWDIALKLNKGEVIDLDLSDQGTVKKFIEDSDQVSNLVKAQLLLKFIK